MKKILKFIFVLCALGVFTSVYAQTDASGDDNPEDGYGATKTPCGAVASGTRGASVKGGDGSDESSQASEDSGIPR